MTDKMTDKNQYEKIIMFLNEKEFITNALVRKQLGLNEVTAKRLLRKMVDDGVIVPIGEKKARKYILKK